MFYPFVGSFEVNKDPSLNLRTTTTSVKMNERQEIEILIQKFPTLGGFLSVRILR